MRKIIIPLFASGLMFGMVMMIQWSIPVPKAHAKNQKETGFFLLRKRMVKDQISHPPNYRGQVRDEEVLTAMQTVPRHLFVRRQDVSRAYGDYPLPIGYGQTISQPYIVAFMSEMLDVSPDDKVLEVGTGSGFQAAILSHLVWQVYTVEIVRALGMQAEKRLRRLEYRNVRVKVADGYYGWKEHAPFDRIIVTAATTLVPPPLLKQLRPGGKMCIPVGGQYVVQSLTLIEKSKKGKITMRKMLPVRFVPLTRSMR
ncbi:MAG: protein-L-isoaspartate(D-aspartate) O-methyltransferase [Desulfatiglandales bacterium]|jgi:protein-L-isoaspartate(D-aspartate) O-methyltransferase|nr:protein-L-isoaspartate(D-aspartate) O-methyltransferase [Desulfatiglandales bacterium]